MEKYSWLVYVALVILAAGLVFSSYSGSPQQDVLTASGNAKATAVPDEAMLSVSVETTANDAKASQQENARIAGAVISAIKAQGVEEKDVKTSSYNVYADYSYAESGRKFEGYKATNTVQVTVRDVSKVGSVIDAASNAGANRIDSVQFRLSGEASDKVRSAVLADAALKAREKAAVMASASGVKLGRVKSVSESSPVIYPVYADAKAMVAEAASTPVQPGEVDVSATVTLVYSI
jgi:uncharacterized protein